MNNIKSLVLSAAVLTIGAISVMPADASAAGSASLALSPSSGSLAVGRTFAVTISENSGGDPVNVVEANLSYDQSKLQIVSTGCNSSAFEVNAPGGNGITCGTSAPKTGGQAVGIVNFKVLAGGSSAISFASSSHIYRSTDNADVWNGAAGGGNYSFTVPAPAPARPAPQSAAPVASADQTSSTPATPNHEVASAAKKTLAAVAPVKNDNNWGYILALAVLALGAATYVYRKPLTPVATSTNKRIRKTLKTTSKRIRKTSLLKAFQRP